MKRITAFFLLTILFLFPLTACKAKLIERGKWENGVYYNTYGQFKIVTNEYFEIYSDSRIKENMGGVYPAENVLNDMIISSDYCAIIVTMERPAVEYTQSAYVEQFVNNTKERGQNGTYELAEPFTQSIAGKDYTCVAVRYAVPSAAGDMEYFEYDYILRTESGVFVILRVTAGTEDHVRTALGMVRPL